MRYISKFNNNAALYSIISFLYISFITSKSYIWRRYGEVLPYPRSEREGKRARCALDNRSEIRGFVQIGLLIFISSFAPIFSPSPLALFREDGEMYLSGAGREEGSWISRIVSQDNEPEMVPVKRGQIVRRADIFFYVSRLKRLLYIKYPREFQPARAPRFCSL